MGIFNSFGAMSGQFAARQERSKVAAALVEELKVPETIAEVMKSLHTNGVMDFVRQWAAGNTAPLSSEHLQQSVRSSALLDSIVRKTNMPVGVVKTSMTVLLPLLIRQLTVGGQLTPEGVVTGLPLTDSDQLAASLV